MVNKQRHIMNIHKLIISLTVLTGISATGCLKEVDTQNPYVRNKGEAYMTVSTERLDFSGRGGALSFTVETNGLAWHLPKYPETVAHTL